MKHSTLLIQAALVVGGLFLYHTLVAPSGDGSGDGAHLPFDVVDTDGGSPGATATDGARLDSGADTAIARRNAEAIGALRRQIAALEARLAAGGGDAGDSPGAVGEVAPLAMPTIHEDDPRYDDDTLKSLELMIDEVNRRKELARNRDRLGHELTRLGLGLSETQHESVIEATLAYQAAARATLERPWTRDNTGRNARKIALDKLKDEYLGTIRKLVPAAAAETIEGSRIARTHGSFFGSPAQADGRRGRDR